MFAVYLKQIIKLQVFVMLQIMLSNQKFFWNDCHLKLKFMKQINQTVYTLVNITTRKTCAFKINVRKKIIICDLIIGL